TTHTEWVGQYQQSDPSTMFEQQVQQQYAAAFDLLKQGQYAKALEAFRQFQNLILTSLDPTLPPNSYWSSKFSAPMDVSLVDTLAAKSASVLLAKPLPSYTFPDVDVKATAPLPAEVSTKLAPLRAAGLALSARQMQLQSAIGQALAAASTGDWKGAVAAFTAALQQVPPAAALLLAAITQDLAIATEKSGGDVKAAITLAQKSADLFGTSRVFDTQVEVLTTL